MQCAEAVLGDAYGKSRLISNRKSDGIFDLYFQKLRFPMEA